MQFTTRHAGIALVLAVLWISSLPATAADFTVPDQSREGPFVIEIHRTFADEAQAELIRRAETAEVHETPILPPETDPPRKKVRAAVGGSLWGAGSFDGVRIASAAHADALTYYVSVIESFGRGEFEFTNNVVMLGATPESKAAKS